MDNQFFERPILNSPYDYPTRHWELDDSGQPSHFDPSRPPRHREPAFVPRSRQAVATPKTASFDVVIDVN